MRVGLPQSGSRFRSWNSHLAEVNRGTCKTLEVHYHPTGRQRTSARPAKCDYAMAHHQAAFEFRRNRLLPVMVVVMPIMMTVPRVLHPHDDLGLRRDWGHAAEEDKSELIYFHLLIRQ